MTSGELVRDVRRRRGLSQDQLALRVGTKQPAISRLENDDVSPSIETLAEVLRAMGEELTLTSQRMAGSYDPVHRQANAMRSPEERLRLAISWNRLAGRLRQAGEKARQL